MTKEANTKRGWIVFKAGGQILLKISVDGSFPGEIRETRELLAEEKKINIINITVSIEE